MYTKLNKSSASFASMRKEFGVVTVRNAKIYEVDNFEKLENVSAYKIANAVKDITTINGTATLKVGSSPDETKDPTFTYLGKIDTLKTASVSTDGPTKTITGGQYNEPLLKYGKTVTVSRQDALGDHHALEALCGTVSEYADNSKPAKDNHLVGRHITPQFATPKMIIGDSSFVDKTTGEMVDVKIIFYKFLPDSLFNLTQEADGDASVFDRNGTLVPVKILVGQNDGEQEAEQVFWSVIDPKQTDDTAKTTATTGPTGATEATGK